jgi:hypothetical protein
MDQTESEWTAPQGLGGWLIPLLLAIWINAGALLAYGISRLVALFHPASTPAFSATIDPFASIVAVAAGLFGCVAGYLLIRKNPLGPTVARTLLALTAGYSLLVLLATFLRIGPVPAEAVPAWVKPAGYLAGSLLALGYLLRSRRVVKTYEPRPDGPNPAEMFGQDKATDALSNRIFRWEEMRSAQSAASEAVQAAEAPTLKTPEPDEPRLPKPEPDPPLPQPRELHFPEMSRHDLMLPQEPDQAHPQESSTQKMNPPHTSTLRRNPEPDARELSELKAQIAYGLSRWLTATTDHPASGPDTQSALLGGTHGVAVTDKVRQRLLDQVNTICEQAWSVHIGDSPTLPNTEDSEGSLPKEIQKWAIAQAVFRLIRALDIRAAMEVYGPFEKLAQDRQYLMAVGEKNSSEDAFGRKVDAAEYESHSGPEIAYKLIVRAQRDMFEADMWARVASLAGDPDFLDRFAGGGARAFEESVEYWRDYANRLRDERGSLAAIGSASG